MGLVLCSVVVYVFWRGVIVVIFFFSFFNCVS